MDMTRKHKLFLIGMVIVLFSGFTLYEQVNRHKHLYILSEPSSTSTQTVIPTELPAEMSLVSGQDQESAREVIIVHIEGKVAQPGVYELDHGARVIDLVEAAGGLLPEADKRLNMAQKLHDEAFLYVLSTEEGTHDQETAPVLNFLSGSTTTASTTININRADQKELETLPGIGPVLAERIINYRQEHGAFKQLRDILQVPGIGDKRFEEMKNNLSL